MAILTRLGAVAEGYWEMLAASPSVMPKAGALVPCSQLRDRDGSPAPHTAPHSTSQHRGEFPLLSETQRGEGMCWGSQGSSGLEEPAFPFWGHLPFLLQM